MAGKTTTSRLSLTYKFAGYEYDSETGNYYAYARYYNPRLGRFMSPDPIGGAITNPQSLNRYAYVVNNPTNFVDPLGLCPAGYINLGPPDDPDCEPAPCDPTSQVCGGGGGTDGGGGGNGNGCPPTDVAAPIRIGALMSINIHPPDCGQAGSGGGGTGGGAKGTPPQQPQSQGQTKTCDVSARVLQGNPATVGFQGGIPGVKVHAGSAAVVPSEFGVGSGAGLAPYALQISGYFPGTGVSFQGATDVIGGSPPMGFNNIRDYLEFINPGQVIIELPTGPDLGRVPAIINVPAGSPCPAAPPFITDPVTGPTVG